ncbi:hypothetical protein RHSIM_Rhsim08G0195200 [Rhododendron simsii]|uniref:Uncharacterized protein n=1 Tax=Rhododendron simsii TaxID=118357 RepID=A0A834LFJ6_RHOSS|nr:hypothetical protein RHSIM_Rhsim08G0195200 [Rhododendron simsii]
MDSCKRLQREEAEFWTGKEATQYLDAIVVLVVGGASFGLGMIAIREPQSENKTLCLLGQVLSLVLSGTPPDSPRQFSCCAVVGNSGSTFRLLILIEDL